MVLKRRPQTGRRSTARPRLGYTKEIIKATESRWMEAARNRSWHSMGEVKPSSRLATGWWWSNNVGDMMYRSLKKEIKAKPAKMHRSCYISPDQLETGQLTDEVIIWLADGKLQVPTHSSANLLLYWYNNKYIRYIDITGVKRLPPKTKKVHSDHDSEHINLISISKKVV